MSSSESSPSPPAYRYWGFISYSHTDDAVAAWLHRSLEGYSVPKALRGRAILDGTIPGRLFPIFRDREELPSASELGDKITEALRASRYLIVVCSPHAAASRWVESEVSTFKSLCSENEARVLCLVVSGEPNGSDHPERGLPECFPVSVRFEVDRSGGLTTRRKNPLAADIRDGKDGRSSGVLKIVAGMLSIGFDELHKRHDVRRRRRWITGSAVGAGLLVVGLAAVGWTRTNAFHVQRMRAALPALTRTVALSSADFEDARRAVTELALAGEDVGALDLGASAVAVDLRIQLLAGVAEGLGRRGRLEQALRVANEALKIMNSRSDSVGPVAIAFAWAADSSTTLTLLDRITAPDNRALALAALAEPVLRGTDGEGVRRLERHLLAAADTLAAGTPEHRRLAVSMLTTAAHAGARRGLNDLALRLVHRARDLAERLEESTARAFSMCDVAAVFARTGRPADTMAAVRTAGGRKTRESVLETTAPLFMLSNDEPAMRGAVETIQSRGTRASVLATAAEISVRAGRTGEGIALAREALSVAGPAGTTGEFTVILLGRLATVLATGGQLADAAALAERAMAVAAESKPEERSRIFAELARTLAQGGLAAAARLALDQSRRWMEQVDGQYTASLAYRARAETYGTLGNAVEARAAADHSLVYPRDRLHAYTSVLKTRAIRREPGLAPAFAAIDDTVCRSLRGD